MARIRLSILGGSIEADNTQETEKVELQNFCLSFIESVQLVSACRVHIESLGGKRFRFIYFFWGRKFILFERKFHFVLIVEYLAFSRVKIICHGILFIRDFLLRGA